MVIISYQIYGTFLFFSFSEKDVYVGYLPLAHVLELVAGKVECLQKCVILQAET